MALPVADCGGTLALLAEGDLPQNVALDGTASDPGDGSSIASYLWRLSKPTGSGAYLSDAASPSPTLVGVDVWGTYGLFLVVTNDLGQSSATAPREAPDSAFRWVMVEEPGAQLVMPAAGQRNWTEHVNRAIAVLRSLRATFYGHTISSHHDTAATGAQLDVLVLGGDATGMHTHGAGDLDAARAGVGVLGVVELADAAADVAHPKAVTRERRTYAATFSNPVFVEDVGTSPTQSWAQAAWVVFEACTIDGWALSMRDAGGTAGSIYAFTIYRMTILQFEANDFAGAVTLGTIVLGKPSVAHAGRTGRSDWRTLSPAPVSLAQGEVIALRCTAAPDELGRDLSVNLFTYAQR